MFKHILSSHKYIQSNQFHKQIHTQKIFHNKLFHAYKHGFIWTSVTFSCFTCTGAIIKAHFDSLQHKNTLPLIDLPFNMFTCVAYSVAHATIWPISLPLYLITAIRIN